MFELYIDKPCILKKKYPKKYNSLKFLSSMSEYNRSGELQAFDDTKAGVRGLVVAGILKIPRIFLHEQYMLEEKKISGLTVPTIDLGFSSSAARDGVVDQVRVACKEWGFFKITNHGIPAALIKKVMDVVKEFHEQEVETKKKYYARDFKNKVVFQSNFDLYKVSSTNWRDTLYLIMGPDPSHPQDLPHVCRHM